MAKKKKVILSIGAIIICIFGILTAWYYSPKTFLKDIPSDDVKAISVFDGNTGKEFTIEDPSNIEHIVQNIQGRKMKIDGVSSGYSGYQYEMHFLDAEKKDVVPGFILNSDDTIRKDPFFYSCDGGLCFDYIRAIEQKQYSDSIEDTKEETNNTKSNPDFETVKIEPQSKSSFGVTFGLPKGWSYEMEQPDKKDKGEIWVKIRPDDTEQAGEIIIQYTRSFGVCGTGLEQKDIVFNGYDAFQGFYDGSDLWSFIELKDDYFGCVILNNAQDWYKDYTDTIDAILSTVQFQK